MFGYWLTYALVVSISFIPRNVLVRNSTLIFSCLYIYFVIFIGLRYEVGGDWYPYLNLYQLSYHHTFSTVMASEDVAYAFLNWFSSRYDLKIYTVNVLCASFFVLGLTSFCRRLPRPMIALAVAVPYMITVLAMGYTRQAAALGFILLALSSLEDKKALRFFIFVTIGAMFHKSAIIIFPLAAFVFSRGRLIHFLGIIGFSMIFVYLFLEEHYALLWDTYVESNMKSDGGFIRVVMNSIPSLLLFIYWKRFKKSWNGIEIWKWLAITSIIFIPLVTLSSTAVDRVALYLMPIQLTVLSRFPGIFRTPEQQSLVITVTIIGYGSVLFVWLAYASHSIYWLPYRNLLFSGL